MDFSFSEEQVLLRNSIQSFLKDNYAFETRRKVASEEPGYRAEVWKQFADLGLLALPFEEKHGGLGNAAVETMIVMEEFGGALVIEPYFPSIILAGGLLQHAASQEQQDALIPPLAKGERLWAFGWAEPKSRFDLAHVGVSAKRDGSDYVISGQKAAVPGGGWADDILFTARTSGQVNDEKGVSLFHAPCKSEGLEVRDYAATDGTRAAEIVFDNLRVPASALIGKEGGAMEPFRHTVHHAVAALSAEAVGCMRSLNAATTEYCKTRKQFGQPIGSFQVLQHRMVDMFMACEEAVSMTYMLTIKLSESDRERERATSAAKSLVGRAGRFIGQQAVQLHGGMGITHELHVGHHFKRLTVIDALFGNTDYHLKRYAQLSKTN